MTPEEITTNELHESAFAELMGRALPAPRVQPLPPGLSERIAAATYASPSFWETFTRALQPAPVRLALGGALSAGVLCAVFLPRLPKSPTVTSPVAVTNTNTVVAPAKTLASPAPPRVVAAVSIPAATGSKAAMVVKQEKLLVKPLVVATTPPTFTPTKVAVAPFKERTRVAPELVTIGHTRPSASPLPSYTAHEAVPTRVASAQSKGAPEVILTSAPLVTQPTPAPAASRTPRVDVALAGSDDEKPFKVALDVTNEQMKQEGKIGSLRSENSSLGVAARPGMNLDLLSAPVK